jgi:hypothetical protein
MEVSMTGAKKSLRRAKTKTVKAVRRTSKTLGKTLGKQASKATAKAKANVRRQANVTARKAKTTARGAAKRATSVGKKAKSSVVAVVKPTATQRLKATLKRLRSKVTRGVRKPTATELLTSDLRTIRDDLSTLGADLVKLSQKTVGDEIEAIRDMTRNALEEAKSRI